MSCDATLVIFCKRPKIGQGKQRLAATLGANDAFVLAVALLDCALEDARNWPGNVVLAVASSEDISWAKSIAEPNWHIIAQPSGNLGERLNRIDQDLREQGHPQLVFIGTDAPVLGPAHYHQVRTLLRSHDVVLSKAEDGGVGIMANSHPWPNISALPWSTDKLGAALAAACVQRNMRLEYIKPCYDIDVEADLLQLLLDLTDDKRPARQHLFSQVQRLVQQHVKHYA